MRLVSQTSASPMNPGGKAGRLEIYHNGVWGTVCYNSKTFLRKAADVVCRQLGYSQATRYGRVGLLQ